MTTYSMQAIDDSKTRRVRIFAKIKALSQSELINAPLNQNPTKGVRSPSPSAATSKEATTTTIKSPSAKDPSYSFYALDQAEAKKIFYFPNPIQKRLLDESIRSENDAEQLQGSILASAQLFNFDRAFSANQSNQAIYAEAVKPLVHDCMQGQSSTVFLYGSTEAGKSYLLRGEDSREKGLTVYAAEEIFKFSQPSKQSQGSGVESKKLKVYCSIYFVLHEFRVDLIQKSTIPYEKQSSVEHSIESEQGQPPYEELISSAEDFKNLYRKATSHLRAFTSQYKNITLTSDAHIIISFKLIYGGERKRGGADQESIINFVKLADVESGEDDGAIDQDFKILKEYLCSKATRPGRLSPDHGRSKLIESIPKLSAEDSLVHFICALPASVNSAKLSLTSLKYGAQLHSEISGQIGSVKSKVENESYGIYLSPHLSGVSGTRRQRGRVDQPLPTEGASTIRERSSRSPVDRSIKKPDRRSYELDATREEQENAQERHIRSRERDINELRYEILSKIDSIIRKSFSLSTRETPINPSRTKGSHEEAFNAERSLEQLKDLLQKNEQLELEVREALKDQAHRHAHTNKKLSEEIEHLSKLLQQREDTIPSSEKERGATQTNGSFSAYRSPTHRVNREPATASRSIEDLNETIAKLRERLYQKKIKNKKKLELVNNENKKAIEMLETLIQENEGLRTFYERERGVPTQEEERFRDLCVELKKVKDELEKKDKIVVALNENSLLQEEIIIGLKSKLQEEKTLNKILTDEQGIYYQKIDSLKKELALIDADNEISFQKHEVEKENLTDFNRSELSKAKEKTKKSSQEIKKKDAKIRELEEELARANLEKERAKHLDEEIIEARARIQRLTNEIEVTQLKNEGSSKERLQDKQQDLDRLQSMENELVRLSEELAEYQSQNVAYRVENQHLQDEDSQKSQLLEKYENQLEYLQTQQIDEIENLHIKLKDFVEQITALRADNRQKNILASTLVEKLAYAEKERDDYLAKYKASRQQCRGLKKNINQIDNKMKNLIGKNGGTDDGFREERVERYARHDQYDQDEEDGPESLWKAAADQNVSNDEEFY